LQQNLRQGLGLLLIQPAIHIIFLCIVCWNGLDNILNLLKNGNNLLNLLKGILLSKHLPILIILEQFIGNNKRLILTFLDGLDYLLLSVLCEVLEVHFLDLFEYRVVQFELLLLLHEE
jgi:hypothetical protein